MKKTYVKPVMESELFVANEYVAACFQIYCEGYKGIAIDGRNNHEKCGYVGSHSSDKDALQNQIYKKHLSIVFGVIGDDFDACEADGKEHWEVEVREVNIPNHPNASV